MALCSCLYMLPSPFGDLLSVPRTRSAKFGLVPWTLSTAGWAEVAASLVWGMVLSIVSVVSAKNADR